MSDLLIATRDSAMGMAGPAPLVERGARHQAERRRTIDPPGVHYAAGARSTTAEVETAKRRRSRAAKRYLSSFPVRRSRRARHYVDRPLRHVVVIRTTRARRLADVRKVIRGIRAGIDSVMELRGGTAARW